MPEFKSRYLAAGMAQVLAQALTAWAVVISFMTDGEVSVWVVVPLAVAAVVPFRHDGSMHDRAVANFGASITMGGVVFWEAIASFLGGFGGAGGALQGPFVMMLLTSTALFTFSGGFFWTLREEAER